MLFIWAKYMFKYRLNIGYGFINSIRRKQNLFLLYDILSSCSLNYISNFYT